MKRISLLLVFFCLMLSLMPSFAQTDPALLIVANGEIYAWQNGEWVKITGEGTHFNPAYSPDGTKIAYNTWSQVARDAIEEFGYWEGDLPTDIAIYDFASNTHTILTSQPENLTVEDFSGGLLRSAPKWSPDGTMLGWSEYTFTMDDAGEYQQIYQLALYDFATGERKVIADDLLPAFTYSIPHDIQWGNNGIYVNFVDFNRDDFTSEVFILYSFTGEKRYRVEYDRPDDAIWSLFAFVAQDTYNDKEVYAIYYPDGLLRLIDADGTVEELIGGLPLGYNVQTPNGLANVTIPTSDYVLNYYVTDPSSGFQTPLISGFYSLNYVHVSPDGTSVAYIDELGNIGIWKNMEIVVIPPPPANDGSPAYISSLTWGIQAIRILRS